MQAEGGLLGRDSTVQCQLQMDASKPITGWSKLCFLRQLTGTPTKPLTALNYSGLQGDTSLDITCYHNAGINGSVSTGTNDHHIVCLY